MMCGDGLMAGFLFSVVGMILRQRPGAVKLFHQQDPHQTMRQGASRQRNGPACALLDVVRQTIGTANDKAWAGSLGHPALQPGRQLRGLHHRTAFVENDALGMPGAGVVDAQCLRRQHPGDCLAGAVFRLQFNQVDARLGRHAPGVFLNAGLDPGGHPVPDRDDRQLHAPVLVLRLTVAGFLATGFFAAGFFAAGFLAVGFFSTGFLTAGFLAAGFFAAGVFVAGAVATLAVLRVVAGFFVAGFFLVPMPAAASALALAAAADAVPRVEFFAVTLRVLAGVAAATSALGIGLADFGRGNSSLPSRHSSSSL